jgi:pimeloyl-ACP methyl ester carboxylesterase
MTTIGMQRGSLLGNSFGCQVIADLAARYPDRVEHAILQGPTTPPEERSWFWQFIRWRQNQRYNPSSLGDVTNEDYKKCGFRRMYWVFSTATHRSYRGQGSENTGADIGGSRRARPDCQSAVVRGYRPYVPARASRDNSRGRAYAMLYRACPACECQPIFRDEAKDLKL